MSTPDVDSSWTTPAHIRARYEGLLSHDDTRLRTWIGDAERILAGRVPDLAARIASGAVDVRDVQRIVAGAVIRYLRNPGGLTQRTTGEGSFNRSESYAQPSGGSVAQGISFTADELADLRPAGLPPGFGQAWSSPSARMAGPDWPLFSDRAPDAEA